MYSCSHALYHQPSVSKSSSTPQLCLSVCVSPFNHVLFVSFRIRLRRLACGERLLKIRNDIVNVLSTDRNADKVLRDTAVRLLLVAELLMRRSPWVDSQGFGVSDTRSK